MLALYKVEIVDMSQVYLLFAADAWEKTHLWWSCKNTF
jgi:hypothetical protein